MWILFVLSVIKIAWLRLGLPHDPFAFFVDILFLEEALHSGAGHCPLYIGDIATAFRQAGDHVDVLAHRQADPHLLAELKATPWFSRNCWTEPSSQGGLGGLRNGLRYGREVSAWLRQHPDVSWVCALTMRLQHLLAFSWLCRRTLHRGHRRYLLLFVQGFGVYQGPTLPNVDLRPFVFSCLEDLLSSGDLHVLPQTDYVYSQDRLAVDFIGKFEQLQEDFNRICQSIGIPPRTLPHSNESEAVNRKPKPFKKIASMGFRLIAPAPNRPPVLYKRYQDYYDIDTISRVGLLYSDDISAFAYAYDYDL